MNWQTISIRLLISIVMSGIIGYEREYHSRPAGVRTHMMVCIGATIIAMIQEQVSLDAINFAIENPEISSVVRYDKTRIIAQVVSGVGFLGAGTIMVQKRSVYGLTTAATIWAVAALGIAIGLGYYDIGLGGFIGIMVTLNIIRNFIHIPVVKKLKISYTDREKTQQLLKEYFKDRNIKVRNINFYVTTENKVKLFNSIYDLEFRDDKSIQEVIEDISNYENIVNIRMIKV